MKIEKGEVLELKPNNPRAIASGEEQVRKYRVELEKMFPETTWTTKVVTYDR